MDAAGTERAAGALAARTELALSTLAVGNELKTELARGAQADAAGSAVELEQDEFVVALAAANGTSSLHKRCKKLRQLLQRMPPTHPARADALLKLSVAVFSFHDSAENGESNKKEAYVLAIAAVEAATEGTTIWAQALCVAWQNCKTTTVTQADRPSWWSAAEMRRRAKLCCRTLGTSTGAWIFQGDILDQATRTIRFERAVTSAEKRAASVCYTKAAMINDGEQYLTHPSSIATKLQKLAQRLREAAQDMEDPKIGQHARAAMQKIFEAHNEEARQAAQEEAAQLLANEKVLTP